MTATSLLVVCANAASGSVAYARQGRIDYRSGLLFLTGTLPGALGGALVVHWVPRRAFDLLFGLLLVAVGTWLAMRRWQEGIHEPVRGHHVVVRQVRDREGNVFRFAYRLEHALVLSAAIGFLSSLLGIGGGIVHVPAMVVALHFPVHLATATSHFVLAVAAGEASLVHAAQGVLGWNATLARGALLSLGAVPGAQVGAWLARRAPGTAIMRALAIGLVFVGGRLVLLGVF